MVVGSKVDLHKGPPFWAFGLFDEAQRSLQWSAIGLLGVAANARAYDVLPTGGTTAIAGNNMVEVEVFTLEYFAAVLAGISVSLENVVPGEFDFLFRHAVKQAKKNDPGHTDFKRDGLDAFVVRLSLGKTVPLIEVECAKTSVGCIKHDMGVAFKEKR